MPGLRRRIYQFYSKLEKWLAPGLNTSQQSYFQQLLAVLSNRAGRPVWLDVGCGHQVFTHWMHQEQDEVIRKCDMVCGIDMDWEGLRKHSGIPNKVMGNLTTLPFRSEVFNVATAKPRREAQAQPRNYRRAARRRQ